MKAKAEAKENAEEESGVVLQPPRQPSTVAVSQMHLCPACLRSCCSVQSACRCGCGRCLLLWLSRNDVCCEIATVFAV